MDGHPFSDLYGFVNLLKFSLLNGLLRHTSSNYPPLSQIF
jgi:hypothetical protein